MFKIDDAAIQGVLTIQHGVTAAWVFGSSRDGEIAPGSDLDIGVLYVGRPSLDELAGLRESLQRALQFDDIDIVVLNGASPITRFEAVSARLIFSRSAQEVAGFVSLTAREYEDSMALLRRGLAWAQEATGGKQHRSKS